MENEKYQTLWLVLSRVHMKINEWFRDHKNTHILATVAAMISAVCAVVAITQVASIFQQELLSKRAYISITDGWAQKSSLSTEDIDLVFSIENVGINPAKNIEVDFSVFADPINNTPFYQSKFKIANDIFQGVKSTNYTKTISAHYEMPTQYFVMRVSYLDPLLNKTFNQCFYYHWTGLRDGKGRGAFSNTSIEKVEQLPPSVKCNG